MRVWLAKGDTMKPSLLPGPALTLWDGSGLKEAVRKSHALLTEARPPIVMLHAGPRELHRNGAEAAAAVRAAVPGVRLWAGVGVDGYPRQLGRGVPAIVADVERLAFFLGAIGVECVMVDAEAAYKAEAPKRAGLLRAVLNAFVRYGQERTLALTSYDQPGLHGTFDWGGALGTGSPVDLFFPQVYAAPSDPAGKAGYSSLRRRWLASRESCSSVARAGVIQSRFAAEHWRPYLQIHNVLAAATVSHAAAVPHCALWASDSRADSEGRMAVRALCRLHQLGFEKPSAVRDFQAFAGLKADGVPGPKTLAALLGDTAEGLQAPTPAVERGTGEAIVAAALGQLGDPYVYGVEPRKDDEDPDAFDCSSLASWAVFQACGVLFGCSRNNTSPSQDASSYDWVAQTRAGLGGAERIAPELAARIPGAVFARAPRIVDGKKRDGHVAISDGAGKLVEAKGGAGVIRSRAWDADPWDTAVLVPGVRYSKPVQG